MVLCPFQKPLIPVAQVFQLVLFFIIQRQIPGADATGQMM